MIKSMTGFGRGNASDEKRNITVEIRAVNHRYCDISVRMSRRYSFAEEKLKSKIREIVSRGKLDVSVVVENVESDDVAIKLNTSVAEKYRRSIEQLKEELGLPGEVTLQYIAALPDVMKPVPEVEDEKEFTELLLAATQNAVEKLDEMRCAEGEKLAQDLIRRGGTVRAAADKIRERAPSVVNEYRDRLFERITELTENKVDVPEERIAVEVAMFADKCNVTEEIVRLDSHTEQLRSILTESDAPVGKKLDFLVQEMNREANTIGSKSNDIETTKIMLSIKNEVEKIREQVQNIE